MSNDANKSKGKEGDQPDTRADGQPVGSGQPRSDGEPPPRRRKPLKPGSSPPPPGEFSESELLDYEEFLEAIERILDWIDKIEHVVEDLQYSVTRAVRDGIAAATGKRAKPGKDTERNAWPRSASSVYIQILVDGESYVSIDGCPRFKLSQKLTALVLMLIKVKLEPKPDRRLTTAEMCMRLAGKFGGPMTPGNLSTIFRRLRKRLIEAGIDPGYVDRRRRSGARFLLAKGVKPIIDGPDIDEVI